MIKNLKSEIVHYVKTNTLLIVYSAVATIVQTLLMHGDPGDDSKLASLFYGLILGFPLCYGIEYLQIKRLKTYAPVLVALVVGFGYLIHRHDPNLMTLPIHILIGASLLFLLAPKEMREDERRGFHWVIFALAAWGLSITIALTLLGLVAFLAWVVKELFGLELHKTTQHFGIAFFTLFVSTNLFGLLKPKSENVASLRYEVSKTVERSIRLLFTPVLVVYLLVLLAYTVKIAISFSLPVGMVSKPIAIAYALFFVLNAYIETQGTVSEGIWGHRKWLRLAFVPLFLIMGIGIFTRLAEYGFTPDRFYLLVAYILMCLSMLIQWRFRRMELRKLIMIATVLIILTSTGPLTAHSVTVSSQTTRAITLMKRYLPQAKAEGDMSFRSWTAIDLREVLSSLQSIESSGGAKKFLQQLDEEGIPYVSTDKDPKNRLTAITGKIENILPAGTYGSKSSYSDTEKCEFIDRGNSRSLLAVKGFDFYRQIDLYGKDKFKVPGSDYTVEIENTKIRIQEARQEAEVFDFTKDLRNAASESDRHGTPITVELNSKSFQVRLEIWRVKFGCSDKQGNADLFLRKR